VESALKAYGEEAFRMEVMYPAQPGRTVTELVGEIPRYESFGANRVEQGIYTKLLRFRLHFEPVVLGPTPSRDRRPLSSQIDP
jgi:hypothetical protein